MSWYGYNNLGHLGVHTLQTPQLALGRDVPAWAFEVKVDSKVIVWVLPKRCGNLARLKIYFEEKVTVIPQPVPVPTPQLRFAYAQPTPRSRVSQGNRQYLGSTVSGASIRFTPKPVAPTINVSQRTGEIRNGNNISLDNSNTNQNTNSNSNVNTNQNNNSATSQANNVVPVNVVVNTGGGDASGSASGSGIQDSGTNQGNDINY